MLASGIASLNDYTLVGNRAGRGSAVTKMVSISFNYVDFISNMFLCDGSVLFLDWSDVGQVA